MTNVNTSIAILGNIRFVKEGAGGFKASKVGQTYWGGTAVNGGTLLAGIHCKYRPFGACENLVVNGDFEDTYSVMSGSGVTSDRAIYVPKGWALDYGPRDANDFNALAAADKQYSSFFAGKAQNSKGGQHTLWMRQRWGASILNYYQEVLLAAGKYQLTADLFATDNSSNNTASVYVGGVTRSVTATNQWQTVTIDFEADGVTPVIIGAKADHKANEFICGFDNFVLTLTEAVGVSLTPMDEAESSKFKVQSSKIYTLAGQQIEHRTSSNSQLPKGVYIVGGKKVVRK